MKVIKDWTKKPGPSNYELIDDTTRSHYEFSIHSPSANKSLELLLEDTSQQSKNLKVILFENWIVKKYTFELVNLVSAMTKIE